MNAIKLITLGAACLVSAQRVKTDPGALGPQLEIVHSFYDQWPTGIAVSSNGRMFANYPAGLDGLNTNNGTNGNYAVGELMSNNTERAYPNVRMNNPPGGAINRTTSPPTSANYRDYLIGVQSVVIDSSDTLWILDTGRAIDPQSGMLALASTGGPKLISVNLHNNSVTKTIVFPPTVAYPDSYLNDVRFDLRKNLSGINGTQGVAYITDSSSEGRNGIIVVDLGTGESWRHLNTDSRTHIEKQFVAFVWGQPAYAIPSPGQPIGPIGFGADGIALGADGKDLYFAPVASRQLYSIPTERLRDRSITSDVQASAAVRNLGQKGVSDGLETDSNGFIYAGHVEQESVVFYNPKNGTVSPFVRDPRINWVDTMSVAANYLYFTVNQMTFLPSFYPGTDRREKPYVLFRAPLPLNGTKVTL